MKSLSYASTYKEENWPQPQIASLLKVQAYEGGTSVIFGFQE